MKIFVLATIALTLILSLGSVLQPVQEYGVGPAQVIHLIGYFLPIILTFVLPMTALFAASLVYGRLASDNELDACRASGISLRTLVYPGLALAIIVAIANIILSFHVMPAFVQRTKKSLKADAQKIVFRNIQRKGYYEASDSKYMIYADQADSKTSTLYGVIIAEKYADTTRIITAEKAKVKFNSHKKYNELQITAYNTFQMDELSAWSLGLSVFTKEFPSLLGDNIKFKKIREIKKIQKDPLRFYPLEKLARNTYAQFTAELLARDITAGIGDKAKRFYRLRRGESYIEFTAGSCVAKGEKKIELSGDIVVVDSTRQPVRTFRCKKAFLYIEGDELAPTLTMQLRNATWKQEDGIEVLDRRPTIYGLLLPQAVTDKFQNENILEAISPAATSLALQGQDSQKLKNMQTNLQKEIQEMLVDIKAEIYSRLVFGIGCIPMIMIGIGLGIIKKEGHVLSAFGASSVPAAVLIVCIMMGKNITKNPDSSAETGILLMWAGLAFLVILMAIIYRKLLKN